MTALAYKLRDGCQHNSVAAGTLPSGSVMISPEGNVIVLQGLKAKEAGDECRWDNNDVFSFTKGAIAFSKGDTVYFDGSDVQKTGFVRVGKAAEAAASGDPTVAVRLLKDCVLTRFSQVAAGAALTASSTPTNLSVAPTIPANVLKVGDKIKIRAQVIATATNASDTLNVKAQATPATSGSAVDLASCGALDVANNDIAIIEFELTIRTIGVSGTMVGVGTTFIGTPGTAASKPVTLASTTIDTTQGQIIGIQGTWSSTNAGNSCRCDILSVELVRN